MVGCSLSALRLAQVEGMVGDLDVSQLASEEALAQPGEREGQHKIVKDEGGTPVLYTWSMAKGTWEKIGEVTGSSGGTEKEYRSRSGSPVTCRSRDGATAFRAAHSRRQL